MARPLLHCPLCAADVDVVMRRTGYCFKCDDKSEALRVERDAVLARKRLAVS